MVPVRRQLLLLVLGALLPLLALAAALTVLLAREERERAEEALYENARLLSHALDAELSRSIAAMQTLSRSPALRGGDLARFYAEAADVRDSLGLWDNVLLLSPGGEHLFNLMRPFGTKLPPLPQPEGPVTATRTRQPYISNALRGRVDTDWLMFMNTPVLINGEVKHVLGVTMNYRYWSRWLAERVPQGLIASIVDRNHVVLARTQDAERLAGQPVQPWFRDLLAGSEGGTVRGRGLLDPDVVVAFHRSELSGWSINVLTSGAALDAPGRRSALLLAVGVALALAIAVALALSRARVLARGIDREFGRLQAGLREQADSQRLLLALHDATRGLREPGKIVQAVEPLVARHYAVSRCFYGAPEAARDLVEPLAAQLEAGRTVAVAEAEGRALLGVPLMKDGRLAALLALEDRGPRAWSAADAALAERVAEQTRLAVENARIEADLRESRDVLALAMRGGRMGAWSRNLVSGEVWWSGELDDIFGLPSGAFEGSEAGLFTYVHPADRPALESAIAAAIAARRDYVIEFRFRHASGDWRWMEGRGRAGYTAEGRPIMLYGVGIDITERKRAENELRRLNEELSEADRRKDEFLATLAHELRNPLAPIRTAAELLKRGDLPKDAAATARGIIERQASHMTRMVEDLLEVGRISRGELQLKKEPVALAAAMRWAVEATQAALDEAGVALAVELPPEDLRIEADPTRLVQIMVNLLANAAKYTPRGGHAWLSARRDGAWAELRVRDDGIGIEPAELPRLFRMFAQIAPALERSHAGLGIGLALVRGLAERHGGAVEARSEGRGRGAEFIVRLPLGEPASEAGAPAAASTAAAAPAAALRVLVADDNRDAADSLAALLRFMGHEVAVAYDGEQVLKAAPGLRPHALILDIGMPRMNGYEVADAARRAEWGRNIVIIALTGWGQQRDKSRAAEAGFDHHLTKPVDVAALQALLSKPRAQAAHSPDRGAQ